MNPNTLPFLLATVQILEAAQIAVWIFGGWAEELWQLTPPRPHHDIDLLYPATNFQQLDSLIAQTPDMHEIPRKRFSHKRAVMYGGVMVEFLRIQPQGKDLLTAFFEDRYRLIWPLDTLKQHIRVGAAVVRVASQAALQVYRQQHHMIEHAYAAYLHTHEVRQ